MEVTQHQLKEVLARLIIELAKQLSRSHPQPPGKCPRCGCKGWRKWGKRKTRYIANMSVDKVVTQRYRCKSCGKTITTRLKEVESQDATTHSVH